MAQGWAMPCGPVLLSGSLRSVPAGPACGRLQSSYRNVNVNSNVDVNSEGRVNGMAPQQQAAAAPHRSVRIAQRRRTAQDEEQGKPGNALSCPLRGSAGPVKCHVNPTRPEVRA
ncbi:hypothetical protein [Pseudoduganella umbonata]|uniref:Uncharacterized protein n=1 Tax=Pseudoduganella umbonata TaxID=864828 RepID=A0A4P8HL50_9BURK|nr:hypothetical protein [Pseudoduganella umbonata]MBB3221669.1 hypothetical protein [Pseudoduganella umbonata]QCP09104.1 hypothetical protein FCL38_00615 [Pseudoduganella umbonata]